ncbi:aminomethyltransferase family protein [Kiloniella sp.]|uniref:aminomethyltransferase family protein n=1 Tax=Kiloniella sp. TaxID=1938587 RepID=UPI003B01E36D
MTLYNGDTNNAKTIIQDEVRNVRKNVGMLDVSTLGKLAIRGPDAGAFLDRIYTMAHAKQPVGRVRYCLMLNDMGSVIDDGVAFRIADDYLYVTATTGAVARVFSEMLWLNAQWQMNVDIQNITAAFAGINVTGPNARKVLESLTGDIDLSPKAFPFLEGRTGFIADCLVRIMRIGFTGELSFELHTPQSYGSVLWSSLSEVGGEFFLKPYGLEASRILRLEKGHIIIGQDTDALSTPDELGMEWALSRKKECYQGKTAIEARRALGTKRKLCGFELPDNHGVKIEESSLVIRNDEPVGFVTSLCHSPTLNKSIGMAYAHPEDAAPGSQLNIRGLCGRELMAAVVSPHFFDPDNIRQDI